MELDVNNTFSNFGKINRKVLNDEISIYYDSREWVTEPWIESEGNILFLAGWFVFNEQRNDLQGLIESIRKHGLAYTLNRVEFGIFSGGYFDGDKLVFFTDFLSLSHHFYTLTDRFRLSPFIELIEEFAEGHNNSLVKFLDRNGYLLGNDTIFPEIKRLAPGCIIDSNSREEEVYFKFLRQNMLEVDRVPSVIKSILEKWNYNDRSIALSSGFDSRLIFSQGLFRYVYSYGPRCSRDRKVSKRLFDLKNDAASCYDGFGFTDNIAPDGFIRISKMLFYGNQITMKDSFAASYSYSALRAKNSYVAFDGFLGGILQRGYYLRYSGIIGEVFNFFPILYRLFPPALEKWLSIRYTADPTYAFSQFDAFINKYGIEANWQSLQIFEVMYGRSSRKILNGGIILNGLHKLVAPPFVHRKIFDTLIQEVPYRSVSRITFKEIWKLVATEYRSIRSEHFYSVDTPRVLIPFVAFVGRVLTHTIPAFYNYGKEHKLKRRILRNH